MKRLLPLLAVACMLLAAAAAPVLADLCGHCKKMAFTADIGQCKACPGKTSSGGFKLCRKCSAKLGQCQACRAATGAKGKVGPKADHPFNGKNLDGWKTRKKGSMGSWVVGTATLNPDNPKELVVAKTGSQLINAKAHSVDMYSDYVHGDAIIKVEVMVPKGSNSGIYVQGEYEIQVLDSYGKDKNPGSGDMGAIYGAAPPTKPKYVKPGEWSTYEIHYQAPKFNAAGKKIANAKFVKVVLNGAVIHENLEMKGPTPGGVDGKEKAKGPIMFQGNHGAVAYRNLQVLPLAPSK